MLLAPFAIGLSAVFSPIGAASASETPIGDQSQALAPTSECEAFADCRRVEHVVGTVELRPVVDQPACEVLRSTPPPAFSSYSELRSYYDDGPCAPDATEAVNVTCFVGYAIESYTYLFIFKFAYSDFYMLSCGPGAIIAECNAQNVMLGAPTSAFGVDFNASGCDAQTIPSQATIGGAPAYYGGIGFAIDGQSRLYTSGFLARLGTVP